jgi:hypothetical protein
MMEPIFIHNNNMPCFINCHAVLTFNTQQAESSLSLLIARSSVRMEYNPSCEMTTVLDL